MKGIQALYPRLFLSLSLMTAIWKFDEFFMLFGMLFGRSRPLTRRLRGRLLHQVYKSRLSADNVVNRSYVLVCLRMGGKEEVCELLTGGFHRHPVINYITPTQFFVGGHHVLCVNLPLIPSVLAFAESGRWLMLGKFPRVICYRL
jgi:hypothetical protein